MKNLILLEANAEKRASDKEIEAQAIELIVSERHLTALKEATTITIDGVRYTRE